MEPSSERDPASSRLGSCPPSLPQPQPDAPFSWLRLFSQLLQRLLPAASTSVLLLNAEAHETDPAPPVPVWGAAELAPLLVKHHFGLVSSSYVLGGAGDCPLPQPLSAAWEELPEAQRLCSKLPGVLQRVRLQGSKANLDVPCPDHGYHSLEEEQQRECGALREAAGSPVDYCQPEPEPRHTHGPPATEDLSEEVGAVPVEDSDFEQDTLPVEARPVCANKLIDYILGGACSGEESEEEEDWGGGQENDDGGFDSEGSFSESDTSIPEEGERLWSSFSSLDPYNPQNFTAIINTEGSQSSNEPPTEPNRTAVVEDSSSWTDSSGEEDEWESSSIDESENLKLWNSFCNLEDPYNLFSFKAQFQTAEMKGKHNIKGPTVMCLGFSQESVYLGCQVHVLDNCEPEIRETLKNGILSTEKSMRKKSKKVTFLEEVTEYYVSNEDRKGPWEELARDGCRFHKRIQETEVAIGYCLTLEHRQRIVQRLQEMCYKKLNVF